VILKNGLHLTNAIIFALLLSFLFSKSQIEYIKHADNSVHIESMMQLGSDLDNQLLQLNTGENRNFDSFVVIVDQIQFQMSLLENIANEQGDFKNITSLFQDIRNNYDQKLELVERYKQRVALVQFVKRSFPKIYKNFDARLVASNQTTEVEKKQIHTQLQRLLNEINFNTLDEIPNVDRIDKLIRTLLKSNANVPVELKPEYYSLLRYASKLLTFTSLLKELTIEISAIDDAQSIVKFRELYLEAFHYAQNVASYYRIAMFVAAIFLLVYLLNLFLRLQSTTTNLNKTLRNLNFQKFAIDQHAIVSITDIKGNITYVNDKFVGISKYSKKELIGQNNRINKSAEHDDAFFKDMWKSIAAGHNWKGVVCNQDKAGGKYWVEATIIPHLNSQGKPDQYISISTDITAKVLAEKDVELLARFPEENPEPVLRFNRDGDMLYANMTAQLVLSDWGVINPGAEQDENTRRVKEALTNYAVKEYELNIANSIYMLSFVPIAGEGYVNIYAKDITARKKAELDLEKQASHDPLTGLFNRHRFDQELTKILLEADQSHQSILLYLDLDQFKIVNDTCGHVAGDELLRQLTKSLVEEARDSDIVARLGGDEFGIILRNCPLEQGLQIAEKIHQMIRAYRFSWEDKSFDVGASMGLVVMDGSMVSASDVLRVADVACYTAKDKGRDNIHVYNEEDIGTAERQAEMHWASMIPSALSENRFLLMAQDIVPLNPDAGLGKHYEILVRMLNTDGAIIPPGAFIPAAERYNLMPAIDHWVVSTAIENLISAKEKYGQCPIEAIAINLSGESMNKLGLLKYIGDQIEKHPFLSSALSFEVTETAAISNLSAAVHFIEELKRLGCEFSLDDFGSGLSSFGYLKNLPVDYLKIDGAFVKDILDDPIDEAMVEAINKIGHVMGIKTIAEFVENDGIAEKLKEIGVDYAQGFGIARPIEFDVIIKRDAELANKAS